MPRLSVDLVRYLCALVVSTVALIALAGAARADVPRPTLEGPITSPGGAFVASTSFDLAQVGYRQEEYFVSGTARAFANTAPLGADGLWTVTPGDTAAYKTRILVNRPIQPERFNGTVIVEWLNVSGGLDASPDWTAGHTELIRQGFAWVGVSAQFAGVEGGGGIVLVVSLPLKTVNPARYGSLHHPGDSFSYDIFSQVAQAIRRPYGQRPLGELEVTHVIAAGESQSAFRMVTYVNAIHPLAHMYDGYLIHSRGAGGAPLSEAPAIPVAGVAAIRSDLDVPVLTLETETDLTLLDYLSARQSDTNLFRLWEVAGTAHADVYTLVAGMTDLGNSPDIVQLVVSAAPLPPFVVCGAPINDGPQHFVVNAAFAALNRWVRGGKPPKAQPRLEVDAGPPVAIVRDGHGNGTGGVRTPQVDVPIATFTGEQAGSILCRLFGTTTPFDAGTLASLYPSHRAFRSAYNRAARRAVRAGVVTGRDGRLMKQWAAASSIGN